MKILRRAGATSQIFQVFIQDSSSTTGGGLTGLVFNTASLTAYYNRDTDSSPTAISLVTMTAGTFTSSGFKEVSSTNLPGVYQFCPPNAALASGASSVVFFLKGATNMAQLPIEVDLDGQADVYLWNGTAVASPATAGIPDINVKNVNNVATTSVTTITANLGTTQPLNFTGTAGSALVKSDMVDVAGAAVSTSTAQLGVNVVSVASAASNVKKNTAFDLSFPMTDATTHAPTTGYTVTATRSIDGAAFSACANSVTEVANGVYNITLAAADTNGNAIMYRFTATGADDRLIEIITQP